MINLSLLSTIEEVFNTQWLMKYYSLQSCFFVSYLLVWEKSYALSPFISLMLVLHSIFIINIMVYLIYKINKFDEVIWSNIIFPLIISSMLCGSVSWFSRWYHVTYDSKKKGGFFQVINWNQENLIKINNYLRHKIIAY